jgi:hypothetical protein
MKQMMSGRCAALAAAVLLVGAIACAVAQQQRQAPPPNALLAALRAITDERSFLEQLADPALGAEDTLTLAVLYFDWAPGNLRDLITSKQAPQGGAPKGRGGGGLRAAVSPRRPILCGNVLRLGDLVSLDVAWDASYDLGGGKLDIFGTPSLSAPSWRHIRRITLSPQALGEGGCALQLDLAGGDPQWLEAGFFRANNLRSASGSGVPDAWVELLGPGAAQMCSLDDGIPDLWRLRYWESVHDPDAAAGADPDLDGLPNSRERALGTSPVDPDTDHDGLTDGEEAGYCEIRTGFVPADMTGATDLSGPPGWPQLNPFVNNDYGFGTFFLSYFNNTLPAYFSGEYCRRVWVELNGVVYVQRWNRDVNITPPNSPKFNEIDTGGAGWQDLWLDDHVTIAACWTDLMITRGRPYLPDSQVLVKQVTWQGRPCHAIEYRNMYPATYTGGPPGDDPVTFQVIIEQTSPLNAQTRRNTIHVGYMDLWKQQGWVGGGWVPKLHSGRVWLGAHNKRTGSSLVVSPRDTAPHWYYPQNGDWITYRVGAGTDPLNPDTSGNGLPDGDAWLHAGDPLKYSTADDFLPDGWKVAHGLILTNSVANAVLTPGALTCFDAYRHGTNPWLVDTDGDGVSDWDEIPHSKGSDPSDPEDGGNPDNCVTLALTVGDPSTSESERWEVHFTNDQTGVTRHHCDKGYGIPKTDLYSFVKGRTYTFRIKHTGTNRGDLGPDYDWQFLIDGSTATGVRLDSFGGVYIVEDPDELLTHLFNGEDINLAVRGVGGEKQIAEKTKPHPAQLPA